MLADVGGIGAVAPRPSDFYARALIEIQVDSTCKSLDEKELVMFKPPYSTLQWDYHDRPLDAYEVKVGPIHRLAQQQLILGRRAFHKKANSGYIKASLNCPLSMPHWGTNAGSFELDQQNGTVQQLVNTVDANERGCEMFL